MKLSLSVLFVASAVALATQHQQTTITDNVSSIANKTFDFVIAGAGLTAIVVGNKLSAQGYEVLLIEAGQNLPDNQNIYNANLVGEIKSDPATECNWNYVGQFENGTDIAITIDNGKCVGGSTSINGMVWYRPTTTELDALENIFGNTGWNSETLIPYMTAAEHNYPPTAAQRAAGANYVPAVHGFNGPVNTSFPTPVRIPEAQRFYKAAVQEVFGLGQSPDLSYRNGSVSSSTSNTVWYDAQANVTRRASAAYSWLYPANQQRNTLTVLVENKVAKVLFDSHMNALGFQFGATDGGELYEVYARREVLLAAGSLGTPPILERSGIGAKAILEKFGITQLVDLPGVGLNLQDQPGSELSGLLYTNYSDNYDVVDNGTPGVNGIFAPDISLLNIDELFGEEAENVTNYLTNQTNIEARAAKAVAAGTAATYNGALQIFGGAIELMTKYQQPVMEFIGETYPSVAVGIFWPLTPLSRGHIHINSSDYSQNPRIVPNFVTDEFDAAAVVTISKKTRSVFTSPAWAPAIEDAYLGPPQNFTDAEWLQWYRETSYGASHWTGTSAMIARDLGGVVDNKLQVYGTNNLRVIDVSILPLQVTAHMMSTAYAISGYAADLILADC